jgi:hypothetical protein
LHAFASHSLASARAERSNEARSSLSSPSLWSRRAELGSRRANLSLSCPSHSWGTRGEGKQIVSGANDVQGGGYLCTRRNPPGASRHLTASFARLDPTNGHKRGRDKHPRYSPMHTPLRSRL